MDSTLKPFLATLLLLAGIGFFLPFVKPNTDYTSLVYKKCSDLTHSSTNDQSQAQTLSTLFEKLLAQSSHSKFFKATAGDENLGISALFQCRGDLDNDACYNCLKTIPEISHSLCNQAAAARFQLGGCYLHYETDGFADDMPKHELLHQTCSENRAEIGGFEEVRDAAFEAVENGVVDNNGFCEMDYEYVHVMAQCEGDLGMCDCGECVSIAVQVVQKECGNSVSGQVYMDQCFVSYAYNLAIVPAKPNSKNGNSGNGSGKTVAIVVAGAAALLAGFLLLRSMRRCGEKDDDV